MGYRSKKRILNRRISNGQKTVKEMFNILSPQGHANPNKSLRFHVTPIRMTKIKNTGDSLPWRGCKVRGALLHFKLGDANLYNPVGNQYGGFSENWVSQPPALPHYHHQGCPGWLIQCSRQQGVETALLLSGPQGWLTHTTRTSSTVLPR